MTKLHKKSATGLQPLQLVGEIVKFSISPKPQVSFKGLKQSNSSKPHKPIIPVADKIRLKVENKVKYTYFSRKIKFKASSHNSRKRRSRKQNSGTK